MKNFMNDDLSIALFLRQCHLELQQKRYERMRITCYAWAGGMLTPHFAEQGQETKGGEARPAERTTTGMQEVEQRRSSYRVAFADVRQAEGESRWRYQNRSKCQ